MVRFYKNEEQLFYAVVSSKDLSKEEINKLCWLLGNATLLEELKLTG